LQTKKRLNDKLLKLEKNKPLPIESDSNNQRDEITAETSESRK